MVLILTFDSQSVILVHGAKIGYFQGDIRTLMDDLKTLKPTVFPVVPRLLNRMFDKVSLAVTWLLPELDFEAFLLIIRGHAMTRKLNCVMMCVFKKLLSKHVMASFC